MEALPNQVYNLIKSFTQAQDAVKRIRESDALLKEGYFNIQGKFIVRGENGYIYRILSPHPFFRIMATYQIGTDIGLTCFLPQQIVMSVPDFIITKQKEIEPMTSIKIKELVSDLEEAPEKEFYRKERRGSERHPRRMDIEKLFLKFYPKEYEKLCNFLSFFQIDDIDILNMGLLDGKPLIFDYELRKKHTLEELQNFYKENNVELKLNYGVIALT